MDGAGTDVGVVAFRYAVVGLFLLFCLLMARWGRPAALVALTLVLGLSTWVFTWYPLARPYGLQAGTVASFDLALASSGASHPAPLDSWVAGKANPRPLWSLLWYAASPGNPERAVSAHGFAGGVFLVLLVLTVFGILSKASPDRLWEWSAASFAAVLCSSPPLDAFRPFGTLFRSLFIESPYRALGWTVMLLGVGLLWQGSRSHRACLAAGILLGSLAWLDWTLFCWGTLSLMVLGVIFRLQKRRGMLSSILVAVATSLVLAGPPAVSHLRFESLARIPTGDEVVAYRASFWDLFAVTGDMEWLFVIAVLSLPMLWKRNEAADRGILSLVVSSYIFWLTGAVVYSFHPLTDPRLYFHAVRFSIALAAGAGGFRYALWLIERSRALPNRLGRALDRVHGATGEPVAACFLVLFLLPSCFAFVWHPLEMDRLYYRSLRPLDRNVADLASWIVHHSGGREAVLADSATSEVLSALTGRPVLMAERVFQREEARKRRRAIRDLVRADDEASVRKAISELDVAIIILDGAFRWEHGEAHPAVWESSGWVSRSQQIGRFAVYRVTRDAGSSRRPNPP